MNLTISFCFDFSRKNRKLYFWIWYLLIFCNHLVAPLWQQQEGIETLIYTYLIYIFILLFISFFSTFQLNSKFTVITLNIYCNACLGDYSTIVEQINDVCAACLDSASYIPILCIFVYSIGWKKEKKIRKMRSGKCHIASSKYFSTSKVVELMF